MHNSAVSNAQERDVAQITHEERLIDAHTFAKILDVSLRTIRAMDARGEIPSRVPLINRRLVRWLLSDVNAWLRAGCPPRDEWEQNARSHPEPAVNQLENALTKPLHRW